MCIRDRSSVLTASVSLNEGFPHPPCFLVGFETGSVVVHVCLLDYCPLVYNFLRIGTVSYTHLDVYKRQEFYVLSV